MMRNKRVFGMLAVIALLALGATRAEAGAGGTPSPLTSFFACKQIVGDDPGRRVDVDSTDPNGWGFNLSSIKLGAASLACAFVRLYEGGTTSHIPCDPTQPPNPLCNELPVNPDRTFTQMKCYAVSVGRSQTSGAAPPSYDVTDDLFPGGTDRNVNSSAVQYICGPAFFQQLIP